MDGEQGSSGSKGLENAKRSGRAFDYNWQRLAIVGALVMWTTRGNAQEACCRIGLNEASVSLDKSYPI